MQIFSPMQFAVLNLWPFKDGPCQALPGGQKLCFQLLLSLKKNFFENVLSKQAEILHLTKFWGAEFEADS